MPILNVYVDEVTERRLLAISRELGRDAYELAGCSIAEDCLRHFRYRDDDPANAHNVSDAGSTPAAPTKPRGEK